jgi:hypothetical protein
MTTTPQRRPATDKLVRHLQTCLHCRAAKIFPSQQRCERGKRLLMAAQTERHGAR